MREHAEAGQRPAETVAKAIEIGARVIDNEGTAANVDYVRAELERHAGALRERLMKQLEAGDDALSERIAGSFDGSRDGSVQKDIEALVESSLEGQREAILKLLRVEDGANPLFDYKQTMVTVFNGLRDAHQKDAAENRKVIADLRREVLELKERARRRAVAEAEEAGTRKGRSFEELVHAEIERIAEGQGDAAPTSVTSPRRQAEEGRHRRRGGRRARRRTGQHGLRGEEQGALEEQRLVRAQRLHAQRDAAVGTRRGGEDQVPAGLEELTSTRGTRSSPCSIARSRIRSRYGSSTLRAGSHAGTRTRLQVDAAGVRDASEEAQAALKRVNRVRKSLTGITMGAEAARTELNDMMEDVEASLIRIDSLVAAAAQEYPEDPIPASFGAKAPHRKGCQGQQQLVLGSSGAPGRP